MTLVGLYIYIRACCTSGYYTTRCKVIPLASQSQRAALSGKSSVLNREKNENHSFTGSSSVLNREKNENQILNVDSGVFNINPPVPVGTLKLLKFVDTC